MVSVKEGSLEKLAVENGWVHRTKRLKGSVNVRSLAAGVGLSISTASTLYNTGIASPKAQAALLRFTGLTFDDLFEVTDEPPALADSGAKAA